MIHVFVGVFAAVCVLAMSACGSGSAVTHATLDLEAVRALHAIEGLGSDVQSAQSDLANFPPDLLSERKDFAFIHPNLAETAQAVSAHAACFYAGNVQAAAQNVRLDLSLVHDDIHTFNGDAERVTNAITHLTTDEATLRRGVKTNGYTPASTPTAAAIGAAISAADTELAAARVSIASYLRAANQLVAQANVDASQAQSICTQRGQ
jgi:hypothetical protein